MDLCRGMILEGGQGRWVQSFRQRTGDWAVGGVRKAMRVSCAAAISPKSGSQRN